jgi:hypothetical protein
MRKLAPLILLTASLPVLGGSFPQSLLTGTWQESSSTDQVCAGTGSTIKYEFSKDGKLLTVKFSKPIETEIGKLSAVRARVVASTSRAITIVYDGEKRLRSDGTPAQWELSVISAGVYRWRETTWDPGDVNIVVGVRCSPR